MEIVINTKDLAGFLPHAGEMVWIDEVMDVGRCRVFVDRKKHYYSKDRVRQSTYIEWIAQAYGFSSAYERKSSGSLSPMKAAYLVSFNKATFSAESISEGEEIYIEVSKDGEMGAISIVKGKVYSKEKNITYCEAYVRLYSE